MIEQNEKHEKAEQTTEVTTEQKTKVEQEDLQRQTNAQPKIMDAKNLGKPRWVLLDELQSVNNIYEFQDRFIVHIASGNWLQSFLFSSGLGAGQEDSKKDAKNILETKDFCNFEPGELHIDRRQKYAVVNGIWFTDEGTYSRDGMTWENLNLMKEFGDSSLTCKAIYFQNGKWYVFSTYEKKYSYTRVGKIFDSDETSYFDAFVLFESSDLKNWTPISMYNDDCHKYNAKSFFIKNGKFFIGFTHDRDSSDNFLMASSDGREWTKVLTINDSGSFAFESFNGSFFIFWSDKNVYLSEDGFSWRKESSNLPCSPEANNNLDSHDPPGVISSPELGLLIAWQYDQMAVSNDGLEWTPVPVPRLFEAVGSLHIFLLKNRLVITSRKGSAYWEIGM